MRGAVSVSDYKFIVLGLIFLKYISDSFEERYKELIEEGYGLEEEKDSYTEKNIFYVPKNARWSYLEEHSKDDNIGEIIDVSQNHDFISNCVVEYIIQKISSATVLLKICSLKATLRIKLVKHKTK